MANPSKDRGTKWETMLMRWLAERLGLPLYRPAPHGAHDEGDIHGLMAANGTIGIVECKDYKSWGLHDLDVWKAQTLRERDNAHADWAVLVPKKYGFGMARLGDLPVHVTHGDLNKLSNISYVSNEYSEFSRDLWTCVSLEELCMRMEFDPDGNQERG